MYIELFIDDLGLDLMLFFFLPGAPRALSYDGEVCTVRDSCTSYAMENTDYLTYPFRFNLFEDEANPLLISVNVLIKL